MFNLTFSPYCAEFEMETNDGQTITRWPRRPLDELERSVKRIRATGAFVEGIALYNNHDENLHEYHRWLEGRWALGYNLMMKKRRSRRYSKLWDAILIPCSGPQTRKRRARTWKKCSRQNLLTKGKMRH